MVVFVLEIVWLWKMELLEARPCWIDTREEDQGLICNQYVKTAVIMAHKVHCEVDTDFQAGDLICYPNFRGWQSKPHSS